MDPNVIMELLEAGMVICFGISWPLSIIKSFKARTAKGKSLLFLLFIFVGYICGIAWKMIAFANGGGISYPTVFYFINLVMVGTDIVLYFRNKALDAKAEKERKE